MTTTDTKTMHTPGPWRNNGGQIEGSFGFPDIIATVGKVNEQSFTDTANARLISAAPDLLNAAIKTLELLSNMTSDQFHLGADKPAREALAAAIARAVGATQ